MQQTTKGLKFWLFLAIIVVVIPVLLLGSAEIGLRAFGYGVPTDFAVELEVGGRDRILSNPFFAWRFLGQQLTAKGVPFSLPAKKEKGSYRIFVFGGSAAQGTPVPAYGMTRMLDAMLRDQYPGVNFEVINAAITATNSHVVLPAVKDCSKLDGDLFVIYLGNNEVVGPYGAGTIFSPLAPNLSLIRAGISLKGTRLGQLTAKTIRSSRDTKDRPEKNWQGMAMFLDHQVRMTEPAMETVYHHFEENLSDICKVGRASRIPVIVSTVGTNLKDCAPFGSLHRPGLQEEDLQQWKRTVAEGVSFHQRREYVQAIERFLKAEEIDPEYAELHFRMGQSYQGMGNFKAAEERFERARDLDTLRFRADTRINQIIRQVAEGKSDRGIFLVDSLKAIEGNSPNRIPGQELFYEHVHLNFHGTYVVAREIYEQIQDLLPEEIAKYASGYPVLLEQGCANRLAFTSWNYVKIIEGLIRKLQQPPFADQPDSFGRYLNLSNSLQTLKRQHGGRAGWQNALAQYQAALVNEAPNYHLHYNYAEFRFLEFRNLPEAEHHLREALYLCPQSAEALFFLGKVLSMQGKASDAEAYFQRGLRYQPQYVSYLLEHANTLLEQKKYQEGVQQLQDAVTIDPRNPAALNALGVVLSRSTSSDTRNKGISHLEKAVSIDPDHASARKNLVSAYLNGSSRMEKSGDVDEAKALLRKASALKSGDASQRYAMAFLYAKLGDRKTAVDHLEYVLEADPNHQDARKLLERIYSGN